MTLAEEGDVVKDNNNEQNPGVRSFQLLHRAIDLLDEAEEANSAGHGEMHNRWIRDVEELKKEAGRWVEGDAT